MWSGSLAPEEETMGTDAEPPVPPDEGRPGYPRWRGRNAISGGDRLQWDSRTERAGTVDQSSGILIQPWRIA